MSLLLALLGPTSSQLVGTPLLTNTNSFPEQIVHVIPQSTYRFKGSDVAGAAVGSSGFFGDITATFEAGETVFVVLQNDVTASGPVTVTDGTNTYTQLYFGSDNLAVFKADNVVAGTFTITGNMNGGSGFQGISYYRYDGLKPSTPQTSASVLFAGNGTAYNDNVANVTGATVTPTAQPALIFNVFGTNQAGASLTKTNFNLRNYLSIDGNTERIAGDAYVTTLDPFTAKAWASPSDQFHTWRAFSTAVSLAAGQAAFPSTIESSNAFFEPTVAAAGGTQTLTPGLYTNSSSYYSPTVSVSALTQTLTPSLYSNSNTYYAPTITVGGVTLLDPLYTNTNTFYNATVSTGAVTVAAPLYTNTTTLFAPSITKRVFTRKQSARKTQPQLPTKVNYSNPLAKGLVGVWQPSTLSTNTNNPTQVVGPVGKGINFTKASSQRLSVPLTKPVLIANTGATIITIGYTTAATGAIGTYASINDGSAYFASLLRGDISHGVSAAYYDGANGTSFTEWFSSPQPDRKLCVSVITADTALNMRVYLNGVDVTVGNQNFGFYGSSPLTKLSVGHVGNAGTSEYLDGSVFLALAYDRRLTPTEVAEISANPWGIFKAANAPVYLSSVYPASLTVPVYTNTNSFFAASVTTGTVTLTPSLYSNSNILYTSSVSISATLQPSLYSNSNTLYTPTITTGVVTLTPSLYSNSNTLYNPTITTGVVTLTPSLYTNSNTLYTGSVSIGAATLQPSLYSNTNTLYSPTITVGGVTLLDPLYSNTNTLYNPTITTGVVTLTPSLYTNSNTLYSPTITKGAVTLTPSLYSNTNTLYNATISTGIVTLIPSLYSNSNTYYVPTITTGAVTLAPSLYTNSSTLYAASVDLVQLLNTPLITNTSVYYTPTIAVGVVTLTPSLYSSANNLYTPTIATGVVAVTAPLLSNSSTLLAPTATPGVITTTPPVLASSNVYYLPTLTRGPVTLSPTLFTNTNTYYTPSIVPGAVGVQVPAIASNSATYAPEVYGTAAGIIPGNVIVDVPSANIARYTESTTWVPTLVVNNVVTFVEVPYYIVNVDGEHSVMYSDSLDYILDKPSGSVSS